MTKDILVKSTIVYSTQLNYIIRSFKSDSFSYYSKLPQRDQIIKMNKVVHVVVV